MKQYHKFPHQVINIVNHQKTTVSTHKIEQDVFAKQEQLLEPSV